MTYMNEENPSKKKYMVPLVVLLLCGVAMTGAAFAYSATLDGHSHDVDPEALNVQFSNVENGHFDFSNNDAVKIAFKSHTTIDDNAKTQTTKYGLDASPTDGYKFTFKVKSTDGKNFEFNAAEGQTNSATLMVKVGSGEYTDVTKSTDFSDNQFKVEMTPGETKAVTVDGKVTGYEMEITIKVTCDADKDKQGKATYPIADYSVYKFKFDVVLDLVDTPAPTGQ